MSRCSAAVCWCPGRLQAAEPSEDVESTNTTRLLNPVPEHHHLTRSLRRLHLVILVVRGYRLTHNDTEKTRVKIIECVDNPEETSVVLKQYELPFIRTAEGLLNGDGARVRPLPRFGLPEVPVVGRAMAEGAHGLREAPHAEAEHAVGQAVDDAVAEAVADGQPGGDEGQGGAVQHVGALQQEVDDVGQPQHVEDAGDAEQHHRVAPIRPVASVVAAAAPAAAASASVAAGPLAGLHLLAGETRPPLADLPVVLLADAKDVVVGEAHHEGGGRVQQAHHEAREERGRGPGVGAPLEDVPVVARFAPPEEGGQEHQAGVDPDEGDAAPQAARRHQLVVGQRLGDGQVPIHADARQARHGHALQDRDDVAEHLAGDGLLDPRRVVEQRQGGHQAAEAHQQVGVGHGLDEVAGGVVVQQRGAVEHEDHRQVAGDDERRQEDDDGRLQDARLQALVQPPAQGTRVVGGPVRKEVSVTAVGGERRVRRRLGPVHRFWAPSRWVRCALRHPIGAAGVKLENCPIEPESVRSLLQSHPARYSLSLSLSRSLSLSPTGSHRILTSLGLNQTNADWREINTASGRAGRLGAAPLLQSLMVSESSGWVTVSGEVERRCIAPVDQGSTGAPASPWPRLLTPMVRSLSRLSCRWWSSGQGLQPIACADPKPGSES
ncbi:hypothetical protein EYF80_055854 [Liparis tanakae]|uniref:Uncharacterized protein n=1 Tax=Liparis tanakae TaxID=230148 RepID=A0A4Z2EYZ8_9TELE|nr:hypothetical protein EYF80_055854 [Liparis tanakae]